jgi:hypothetical protein
MAAYVVFGDVNGRPRWHGPGRHPPNHPPPSPFPYPRKISLPPSLGDFMRGARVSFGGGLVPHPYLQALTRQGAPHPGNVPAWPCHGSSPIFGGSSFDKSPMQNPTETWHSPNLGLLPQPRPPAAPSHSHVVDNPPTHRAWEGVNSPTLGRTLLIFLVPSESYSPSRRNPEIDFTGTEVGLGGQR